MRCFRLTNPCPTMSRIPRRWLWLAWSLSVQALCVHAQFQAIDRHALKAPDSLARNFPALVAYLIRPAQTETEKARSLYTWLTHYLAYDQSASNQGRRINQSLEDIIRRKRGTCFDYAQLYQAMCREAGLNGRVISGYARPRLSTPVPARSPDHAWNAVQIDGTWQLVDATWGNAKDEWRQTYGRDYFLPPPELFVLNHLPANPIWQLLDAPVDTTWFKRPASQVASSLGQPTAAGWVFKDSIAVLLALPYTEQIAHEAEAAFRFYPTAENRRAWAHALLDLAVQVDESSEHLPMDSLISLKHHAIALCRQAASMTSLYDWQKEFYIGLHLDLAVAYNQRTVPPGQPSLERQYLETSRKLLLEAQAMLENLPPDGIFRAYALERCRRFLAVVEYNLERL